MQIKSGIYAITAPSGHRYIGSSLNIPKRWGKHRTMLKRGEHHCPGLQAAWRKYDVGISFSVLLICSGSELIFFEQRAIDILKPKYNAARIAGTRAGVKWSLEARARLKAQRNTPEAIAVYREAALRRGPMSAEQKAKISATLATPEVQKKLSIAHSGKFPSAETRAKLSAAHMGNKSWTGRRHSPETRAKMSRAHFARS
jgi:group I intron endonuclease